MATRPIDDPRPVLTMIALLALAVALAALPFAMTLINLRALTAPAPAPDEPRVAILIPARDEEAGIAACAEHALASHGVALEVVVLDDHSSDRTAAIVADLATRDRRLRLERAPTLPPGWSGKQHACHVLAQHTDAPVLVFVDADVRLEPDAAVRLAGALGTTDLASGVPRQVMGSLAELLVIPMINTLLLGYLPIPLARRDGRSALGAACGQMIAVRADAYRRAGGHAGIRASLHDGLALPRLFRASGLRTDLVAGTGLASCRMYVGWRATVAGTMKNASEGMARPLALPVWTVLLGGGHVLPWALLIAFIADGRPVAATIAAVAGGGPIAARWLQAVRCREPVAGVPLHPFAVTLLIALQWAALLRHAFGRPATWRGRTYPAGN